MGLRDQLAAVKAAATGDAVGVKVEEEQGTIAFNLS